MMIQHDLNKSRLCGGSDKESFKKMVTVFNGTNDFKKWKSLLLAYLGMKGYTKYVEDSKPVYPSHPGTGADERQKFVYEMEYK